MEEPKYSTSLVTELQPDGTLEAVEVVEVPFWVAARVRFLFGVRSAVVSIAQILLAGLEWIVDTTDRFTLKHIPPELIDHDYGKKKRRS